MFLALLVSQIPVLWTTIGLLYAPDGTSPETNTDAFQYTDILADFVILVLPTPMVSSVKLDTKKKLAVSGMLTLGAAKVRSSIHTEIMLAR